MSLIKISKDANTSGKVFIKSSNVGPGQLSAQSPNKIYNAESVNYFSKVAISDPIILSEINQFIVGLRDMKVYDRTACWLLRSSQNKNSGNIAYSFGGLAIDLEPVGFNHSSIGWESDGVVFFPNNEAGAGRRLRGIIFDRFANNNVSKIANASNPLITNNTMFWCGEHENLMDIEYGEECEWLHQLTIEGAAWGNGTYTEVTLGGGLNGLGATQLDNTNGEYIIVEGNNLTLYDPNNWGSTPVYYSEDGGVTWTSTEDYLSEPGDANPPPEDTNGIDSQLDLCPNNPYLESNVFSIGQPGAGTHILTNIVDNTIKFYVPRTINSQTTIGSVSFNAGDQWSIPYVKTFNFVGLFMGETSNSSILNNSSISTTTNLGTRTFNECCNPNGAQNTEISIGITVPGWDNAPEEGGPTYGLAGPNDIKKTVSFAMSTNLTSANQLQEIYSLYKSTVGKNLGLL